MHRLLACAALAALAACGDASPRAGIPADSTQSSTQIPPPAGAGAAAWTSNPAEGVSVTVQGGDATVQTGPHAVLWPGDAADLAPPYTVRATLTKDSGRLHEGYGLVFGGTGLDAGEAGQAYSYFLVRGDGSFLIKRRDAAGAGRANRLEVRVGADTVVFVANDAEVARVPASELAVNGRPGIRVAHDLVLRVTGFRAGTP
ncbi:MAG: hypothetical protein AVDCRST_MAG89-3722 [uncultured Gemmatimonadetes bacterium]|uniref:Uncharacterized protein n=1 Tax=uncultured Gemmatimonadota bacterium TaxID=203437 RepID=A0A6J4MI98_9BACT|nr:MAG: hypothetical protein AVDCRST_MAG89-3722 [uncultured Gemmatimonadota bacterium]